MKSREARDMRRQIKDSPWGGARIGQRVTPLSSLEPPAIAAEESLSRGAKGIENDQAQTAELGVPRIRRFDLVGRSRRHSSFKLAALVSASSVCGASLPVSENPTTTSEGSRFVARAVTFPCCGLVNECIVDSNEQDSAPGAKTVRPHGFGHCCKLGVNQQESQVGTLFSNIAGGLCTNVSARR